MLTWKTLYRIPYHIFFLISNQSIVNMTAISTAKEYTPKLQKRTLKGHKKAVLCLAHSSERLSYYNNNNNAATSSSSTTTNQNPNLLLSGSEDGTARLWDLRTRKTSICMELPRINAVDRNEVVSGKYFVLCHYVLNKSLGDFDTSFGLHWPLFDCLCIPHVLTEVVIISLFILMNGETHVFQLHSIPQLMNHKK